MLIKYNPSKLLAEQLVPNTKSTQDVNLSPATEKKLFGNLSDLHQYKNKSIEYAPIFVAGLQVNVTAEHIKRQYLGETQNSNVRYYLKDNEGADLAAGKFIDKNNIDNFFRDLYDARKTLTSSPQPQR